MQKRAFFLIYINDLAFFRWLSGAEVLQICYKKSYYVS
jgi:hypothetical protein